MLFKSICSSLGIKVTMKNSRSIICERYDSIKFEAIMVNYVEDTIRTDNIREKRERSSTSLNSKNSKSHKIQNPVICSNLILKRKNCSNERFKAITQLIYKKFYSAMY